MSLCGAESQLNQIHRYAVLHQQLRVAVAEYVILVPGDGHGAGLLGPSLLLVAFRQDIFQAYGVALIAVDHQLGFAVVDEEIFGSFRENFFYC